MTTSTLDYALLAVPIDLVADVHAYVQDRLEKRSRQPAGFLPQPQDWSEDQLRYFDRDDNPSLRRYRELLDLLSGRPGRTHAMSRVDQAAALGITPEELDSVFTNVSHWLKRDFERKDPPARWVRGDDIDPALPRVSYRWMSDQDAQTWRKIRGLPEPTSTTS